MSHSGRVVFLSGVAASVMFSAAYQAEAGGFALREQSTYGQGSSFAGISAGGASPSAMFWNPATITQHDGFSAEAGASLIWPHSDIEIDEASGPVAYRNPLTGATVFIPGADLGQIGSDDHGQGALVPMTYGTYQVNEQLFLGLGVNSAFGLVTSGDPKTWSGRYHGITSDVFSINVNPNIAYKVNDWLSVGVGLQVQYIDARLNNSSLVGVPVPTPAGLAVVPFEGTSEFGGDDYGFGFTAGITLSPTAYTTVGIGYRSHIEHTLKGDANITFGSPLNTVVDLGDVRAEVTLPEQVSLGVRHEVNDRWAVLGQVEWTNWSRFDELRVEFDDPTIPDNVTVEDWDDGWFFALGAEFAMNETLTLRAGAAYELTPVPDETRTPRIPDADRLWLSLGATYQATERLSIDIAYTHIFADDAPMAPVVADDINNATRGDLIGESEASVDILSAALRFKFGGEPVYAAPAEEQALVPKGF